MSEGVLLFCFDTEHTKYHRILERCVKLVKKNICREITVVTNFSTYKKINPLGFINYKFIEPELGNTKLGKEWNNADRHMAYELSPYDTTLVMDIDYFCFTDTLKQFLYTDYDFLVPDTAHDLSGRKTFDPRRWSMIPMVWATVLLFKKNDKVKKIFDTVKYIKQHYSYFTEMYRIYAKNLRNDYLFAMALQQINGFIGYEKLPFALPTLPPDCEVVKITDTGLAWKHKDQISYVENQDVHVLNKEAFNV
jgi:hypothetical protein|tara:strand:- start:1012 stop:1761 length:750 start_codon:yes stop_codon:yes gene_type:complete